MTRKSVLGKKAGGIERVIGLWVIAGAVYGNFHK